MISFHLKKKSNVIQTAFVFKAPKWKIFFHYSEWYNSLTHALGTPLKIFFYSYVSSVTGLFHAGLFPAGLFPDKLSPLGPSTYYPLPAGSFPRWVFSSVGLFPAGFFPARSFPRRYLLCCFLLIKEIKCWHKIERKFFFQQGIAKSDGWINLSWSKFPEGHNWFDFVCFGLVCLELVKIGLVRLG